MNRMDLDYIQDSICYIFENLNLLIQAFTRKSYSEEHSGTENNEVLEFYGDEILDLYVTKLMYKETGKVSEKGFISSKTEGELTKLKAAIVNKKVLAACIQNFGFERFLIMGNGRYSTLFIYYKKILLKHDICHTKSINLCYNV